MSSATQLPGGLNGGQSSGAGAPTLAQKEAQFELGITLTLFLWPSLSLAVSNQWGGPTSSEKREMFAASAIELLKENPDADEEWIEEFLLQVMEDEFEVAVDDSSSADVAQALVRLRDQCGSGDFGGVQGLQARWERRGGNAGAVGGFVDGGEVVEEGSSDEDEDEDGDVDMDEVPQLVRVREKEPVVPEVDEDGFTKVTKKKR